MKKTKQTKKENQVWLYSQVSCEQKNQEDSSSKSKRCLWLSAVKVVEFS